MWSADAGLVTVAGKSILPRVTFPPTHLSHSLPDVRVRHVTPAQKITQPSKLYQYVVFDRRFRIR
jgi:hypothetical protein